MNSAFWDDEARLDGNRQEFPTLLEVVVVTAVQRKLLTIELGSQSKTG
jgi:hypothetical protein